MCAVSVVVIACLLLAILGWRPAFIVQREGEIIVAALCRYKEEQGLWPLRISDVAERRPDLLKGIRRGRWRKWLYMWRGPVGIWLVYYRAYFRRARFPWQYEVRYEHGEPVVHGDGLPELRPEPLDLDDPDLVRTMLAEFDWRIEREPSIVHCQGKISWLWKLGRHEEALKACKESVGAFPNYWWPRVARAKVETALGRPEEALENLLAWAGQAPSFERYWSVFYFLRHAGKPDEALSALQQAVKYPAQRAGLDYFNPLEWNLAHQVRLAARWAHRHSEYELSIELLDARPEGYVSSRMDVNDRALIASCRLALGQRGQWLEDARRAGDPDSVFETGSPWDYKVFIDYE